ncbi:hypothetical protein ACN9MF_17980 [Methylobacterium fujisawaense]|uniref:hypothetical protein n=1 Tax=Methylobacterium fujisawaense TaxID=107400 RepID=UPI003CF3546C
MSGTNYGDAQVERVWNQKFVPVAWRHNERGEKLWVRMPYASTNRAWLQKSGKKSPEWIQAHKRWETPKSWFDDLVDRFLERYGKVYIIQPFREQEKCSPACQNAKGHECQCSCMGANHGAGNDGSWFEVSETFATKWSETQLACRLLTKRPL